MAHSVAVNDMVTRARVEADIETSDQANSIATDAQLVIWLDRAYRELYDLVLEAKAGLEHFGVRNTAFTTPWAVASTVYRVLALEQSEGGDVLGFEPFNFAERNAYSSGSRPRWRRMTTSIIWTPEDPTGTLTMWYLPTPTALVAGNSVDVWNGWDDYLVNAAVMHVRAKQEYDVSFWMSERDRMSKRIRDNAARLRTHALTMADTRAEPDRNFYNG